MWKALACAGPEQDDLGALVEQSSEILCAQRIEAGDVPLGRRLVRAETDRLGVANAVDLDEAGPVGRDGVECGGRICVQLQFDSGKCHSRCCRATPNGSSGKLCPSTRATQARFFLQHRREGGVASCGPGARSEDHMSDVPREFGRIKRLPPYVFNITAELKM